MQRYCLNVQCYSDCGYIRFNRLLSCGKIMGTHSLIEDNLSVFCEMSTPKDLHYADYLN